MGWMAPELLLHITSRRLFLLQPPQGALLQRLWALCGLHDQLPDELALLTSPVSLASASEVACVQRLGVSSATETFFCFVSQIVDPHYSGDIRAFVLACLALAHQKCMLG